MNQGLRCLALAIMLAQATYSIAAAQILEDIPNSSDALVDPGNVLIDDPLAGLEDVAGASEGSGDSSDRIHVSDFRGFLRNYTRTYVADHGGGGNDILSVFEIQMEIGLYLSKNATGYFRPRLLIDAYDDDFKRAEPLEAYATWSSDNYDVRLGQFVENWGIADTSNPLDVLNRRDLGTDFLDSERLGEIGVRYRHFFQGNETFGEPVLGVYVLPVFQKAQFPTRESRFSFSQPSLQFAEDQSVTPNGLDRLFVAVRGQSTLNMEWASADAQFVIANGPDRTPAFRTTPLAGGLFAATPVYFGTTVIGGGIRAVPNDRDWADYTLKAELAYKIPYRFDDSIPTPDDYFQYAVGFDRPFNHVFIEQDQVLLTLEFAGEFFANDSLSRFRPFDHDIVCRVGWDANDIDRKSVELRGVLDVVTGEIISELTYERLLRQVHPDLKFAVGAQIFIPQGGDRSFLTAFPNNTNLLARFQLDF